MNEEFTEEERVEIAVEVLLRWYEQIGDIKHNERVALYRASL